MEYNAAVSCAHDFHDEILEFVRDSMIVNIVNPSDIENYGEYVTNSVIMYAEILENK